MARRDPRRAPVQTQADPALGRRGRAAGLATAGAGLFWLAATAAGAAWGWPTRTRALCDLIALAGFAWALYLTYRAWRARRTTKG